MRPVTQSRAGRNGTCFRACLASILNLDETEVPDFPLANEDPGVDRFLAPWGLRYEEVPVGSTPPVGYHTIAGESPRGGQHAVVGLNGLMVWDPHPQDGTGRGLVTQERYGLLLPLAGAVAMDVHQGTAVVERGEVGLLVMLPDGRVKSAQDDHQALRIIQAWCKKNLPVGSGMGTCEIQWRNRAKDAADWCRTTIGGWVSPDRRWTIRGPIFGKPMYWVYHDGSRYTPTGRYDDAVNFTSVAEARRFIEAQGGGKVQDVALVLPYRPGDLIKLKNGKRTTVSKVILAKNLFNEPEWHVSTTTGEVVVIPIKCGAKDADSASAYRAARLREQVLGKRTWQTPPGRERDRLQRLWAEADLEATRLLRAYHLAREIAEGPLAPVERRMKGL